MISIRNFVQNRDEKLWLRFLMCYAEEDPDFIPYTFEQFRNIMEKFPDLDPSGMFIAEIDGIPAGIASGIIDRKRNDRKAWFGDLTVLPEFRKKGIGHELTNKVLSWLKENNQIYIESSIYDKRKDAIKLAESYGFSAIRGYNEMERNISQPISLQSIKSDRSIRKSTRNKEDIELLMQLRNDSFSKHYNFRPLTFDEIKMQYIENPEYGFSELYFTFLDKEPVGFIVVSINDSYNIMINKKIGWIHVIGVLEPYRKRGIGTDMLMLGMKRLKDLGMDSAFLFVDTFNVTKAIDLYKEVGFTVKKSYIVYSKELA